MSSIEPENIILTNPAGTNVGLNPDVININSGNFSTSLTVAGIDIGSSSTSSIAHIISTSNVHGVTGNVVGTTDTQTIANKAIDSASNTMTITNGALIAANVNILINQDMRTTSSPTFTSINTGIISNSGATLTLPTSTDTILARNTTDTLTNKTINSGNNNVIISSVSNTNINSILNQSLLSTSNVSFNNMSLTSYAYCNRNGSVGIPLVTSVPNSGSYVNINITALTFGGNQFASTGNTGVIYNGTITKRFLMIYNMSLLCDTRYITSQLAINGSIVQGSRAQISASSNSVYTNASINTVAQLSLGDTVDILPSGDLILGNIDVSVVYLSIGLTEIFV